MARWSVTLGALFVSCSEPLPTPAGADVVGVDVAGEPDGYIFAVSIRSDETGCDQYANWWEILTSEGELIYRRVLNHSHPTEQPFTRSGDPVPIGPDTELVVRAHMHPTGYTGRIRTGTPETAFFAVDLGDEFALDLEHAPPLPESCLF